MRRKKIIITLNQTLRSRDIEDIRKDIARQLKEGIVVLDSRIKDIMVVDNVRQIEIRGDAK